MNLDWEIQKRSHECLACQRSFGDEDLLHCLLLFEAALPVRKDYCQPCWEAEKQLAAPAGTYSYWQSRCKVAPPTVKVKPVKRDLVELLLKKYLPSEASDHKNLCYILAVMLERKKVLSQKDSITGPSGGKVLVYENNKTGETFVIADPQLKLTEIPFVQQQVKALLDAELQEKEKPVIASEVQQSQ